MSAPLQGSDEETQERISGIRARLSAATPGEWADGYGYSCKRKGDGYCPGDCNEHRYIGVGVRGSENPETGRATTVADCGDASDAKNAEQSYRDANFIANAPTDLAFLLSRVDSLESALREAQKDVERLDWLGHRTNIDTVTVFPGDDLPFAAYLYAAEPIRRTHTLREAIDAARDAARADTGEST